MLAYDYYLNLILHWTWTRTSVTI